MREQSCILPTCILTYLQRVWGSFTKTRYINSLLLLLLTHKVGRFVPLHVDHLSNWHRSPLIRFQSIVFTLITLVTDERTNGRTDR